jgi:hypothetical protein
VGLPERGLNGERKAKTASRKKPDPFGFLKYRRLWMKLPENYWGGASGYQKLKTIASGLEVVNECAERAKGVLN